MIRFDVLSKSAIGRMDVIDFVNLYNSCKAICGNGVQLDVHNNWPTVTVHLYYKYLLITAACTMPPSIYILTCHLYLPDDTATGIRY